MRKAGILLPLSSLPAPHGIGTLGHAAYEFVDFLAQSGQSYWQILPVGPTGYGDSPYQSFSAFAGSPYYIDLELLQGAGLLEKGELGSDWGKNPARVDYGLLYKRRFAVLQKATARQDKSAPEYRSFCQKNAFWLDDYALFMALKEAHGGAGFATWPDELRLRQPAAIKAANAQYAHRVEFWRCLQYFFFSQWSALKLYAGCQGVGIVGDIPIYVSDDSSDLWAGPELFLLDGEGRPKAVAGVPPDAFSEDGQLWGNPLYDWKEHKRTRYAWWLARLRQAADLFDMVRIDHFRGFSDYYAIPAGAENAKPGQWQKGPGMPFIRAVRKALPKLAIIAEDLGFLTQNVHDLLAYSRYPGMKVLQFAFDSREESDYLPHNYPRHCVVYTGTHDNTTTEAWAKEAKAQDVAFARRYLGLGPRQAVAPGFIRFALCSVADTAMIPLQDWLGLGASARVNTPSTLGPKNWTWRLLPGQLTAELAAHIRLTTRTYGRLSDTERQKMLFAEKLSTLQEEDHDILPLEAARAAEKQVSMEPVELVLEALAELPSNEKEAAMRVLTAEGMRKAEEAAMLAGTNYQQLMENAGTLTAKQMMHLTEERGLAHSALFLCGKGNNAGDAFVAARVLAGAGWQCQVVSLLGEKYSDLAKHNLLQLPESVARPTPAEADYGAAFVVDGVFGTGYKGPLPAAVKTAFAKAARSEAVRIALDLPSGLDCDSGEVAEGTFQAAYTFTFGAYKPGLLVYGNKGYTGEVVLLDIGV